MAKDHGQKLEKIFSTFTRGKLKAIDTGRISVLEESKLEVQDL